MKRLLITIAKGFEEIEAINIIDILRRGGLEVIVAGVEEIEVRGAHQIKIVCDELLKDVDTSTVDMIILPGGWGGTKVLAFDPLVQSIIKEFDTQNKYIGAICAAPYALALAGVLKNNFTCYPSSRSEIETEAIYHEDKAVVIDGKIITSRGPATAICFGLAIVELFVGTPTMLSIKGGTLADFC